MPQDSNEPSPRWQVLRHGGMASNRWRVVIDGDEQKCRKVYDALVVSLRQGGIRLVDPTGEVKESASAPRLRTRW